MTGHLATQIADDHQLHRAANGRMGCSCGNPVTAVALSPAQTHRAFRLHIAQAAITAARPEPGSPAEARAAQAGLVAIADRIGELVEVVRQLVPMPPRPVMGTWWDGREEEWEELQTPPATEEDQR